MKTSIFALCLIFANFAAHADYLGRATWKRLDLRLRLIPKGGFTMGSPPSEKGRFGNEEQVEVTITRDFQMMATEVTQRQWVLVTGFNPSHFKNPKDCPDSPHYFKWTGTLPQSSGGECFLGGDSRLSKEAQRRLEPVELSGNAPRLRLAVSACRRKRSGSAPPGREAPPPTILETTPRTWGITPGLTRIRETGVIQWQANCRIPLDYTICTANMLEWVQDWYAKELLGGRDPLHGRYGSGRVLRGGGWNYYARGLRSAFRTRALRYRASYIGFRLVRGRPPLPRVSLEELDLRLRPISKGSFTMGFASV